MRERRSAAEAFLKARTRLDAMKDIRSVHAQVEEFMKLQPTLAEIGRWLFTVLPTWDLSLSGYISVCFSPQPLLGQQPCPVMKDLLPIPVDTGWIEMKSQGFTDSEVCWSFLMMWSCSYLFNGHLDHIDLKKDQPLSGEQISSLFRFGTAAQRFLVSDEKGETLESLRSSLSEKALGYGGETFTICRELEAELIVPTWPAPGRAAVQPAVRFLDGDLLRQVLQPRTMLNPVELWPEEPRLGIAHATQEELNFLVKAGYERGIF